MQTLHKPFSIRQYKDLNVWIGNKIAVLNHIVDRVSLLTLTPNAAWALFLELIRSLELMKIRQLQYDLNVALSIDSLFQYTTM